MFRVPMPLIMIRIDAFLNQQLLRGVPQATVRYLRPLQTKLSPSFIHTENVLLTWPHVV